VKAFFAFFFKGFLTAALSISMVVSCIWLLKLIVINLPEWKGTSFDFFYEYKISICVALALITIGIFINTKGNNE